MKFRDRKAIVLLITTTIFVCGLFGFLYLNDSARSKLVTDLYQQLPLEIRTPNYEAHTSSAFIEWPHLMENPKVSEYPRYTSLLQIVQAWNPDVPEQPVKFVETLQHFNYSDLHERAMAERFRNAELPFKVYDVPEFMNIHEKWNNDYLNEVLKNEKPHVERSKSNHFMYWTRKRNLGRDYKSPTDVIDMTYPQFLRIAENANKNKVNNATEHYYFMTGRTLLHGIHCISTYAYTSVIRFHEGRHG